MASLNHCQFIGHVGKDPEIRSFQNGNRVASFSLACSNSWKDKQTGERKEQTEWINISVFDERLVSLAENYITKGKKIYVQGTLHNIQVGMREIALSPTITHTFGMTFAPPAIIPDPPDTRV